MRSRNLSPRSSLVIILSAVVVFAIFASLRSYARHSHNIETYSSQYSSEDLHISDHSVLSGPVIAARLKNETLKAELGRAAWKLFHTTLASFPEKPTTDESSALQSYIYLFQRLYPCGECAKHFGLLLERFPPQVSSRNTAAAWGCHVHNEVNKSLDKEIFDCSKIGDFYDCGCGDAETEQE